MNRETYFRYFEQFQADGRAIMEAKNADYAQDDDPFSNFRLCETIGIAPMADGILVRMLDKVARLSTYLKTGQYAVKGESFRDACVDLANYAASLAAAVESQESAGSVGHLANDDIHIDIPGTSGLTMTSNPGARLFRNIPETDGLTISEAPEFGRAGEFVAGDFVTNQYLIERRAALEVIAVGPLILRAHPHATAKSAHMEPHEYFRVIDVNSWEEAQDKGWW